MHVPRAACMNVHLRDANNAYACCHSCEAMHLFIRVCVHE